MGAGRAALCRVLRRGELIVPFISTRVDYACNLWVPKDARQERLLVPALLSFEKARLI